MGFDSNYWLPGADELDRKRMTSAHTKNHMGVWVMKEVPAAASLDEWLASWTFHTGMAIFTDFAAETTMDLYRDNFVELTKSLSADEFAIASKAERSCRVKRMPKVLQELKRFSADHPGFSTFSAERPWEAVIQHCCKGVEASLWWQENLRNKVHDYQIAKNKGELASLMANGGAGNYDIPEANPAWKRRRGTRGKGIPIQLGTKETLEEPADSSRWQDKKRPVGRYMFTANGVPLCFDFGRWSVPYYCNGPCANSRAHGCEWCRGNHKAIRCEAYKSKHGRFWSPPGQDPAMTHQPAPQPNKDGSAGKNSGKGKDKGKGKNKDKQKPYNNNQPWGSGWRRT